MRRRHLTAALLVVTLGACTGRSEPPDQSPSADGGRPDVETSPEETDVTCPATYDYELFEDSIGPTPQLPLTRDGAVIELRINVLDLTAEPPAVNLSWQTVPASDLPARERVFMKQQVGDLIDIEGVELELTGLCAGRVTFDQTC